MTEQKVEIKNRKASFEYAFLEKFIAGLALKGTEIKSIREGKANITEAYCVFVSSELFIRNMNVQEYGKATHFNHAPKRDRKLLLKKHELNKLEKELKNQGLSIIPLFLFVSKSGYAKIEIALAKGKKTHDKRQDIKKKDLERETKRKFK